MLINTVSSIIRSSFILLNKAHVVVYFWNRRIEILNLFLDQIFICFLSGMQIVFFLNLSNLCCEGNINKLIKMRTTNRGSDNRTNSLAPWQPEKDLPR